MKVSDLIPAAFLQATGELFDGVSGDDDWNKMLAYANILLPVWANEPGGNWESLYDPAVQADTVAASDTYELPDGFIAPSNKAHDYVYTEDDAGNISKFTTVPGPQLKYYRDTKGYVAIGSSLIFSKAFTATDPEYGATIYVPGFVLPDVLKKDSDLIPIDDPQWLVYMCAQEWAQADVTLVQNVPSLVSKANDRMDAMKLNNKRMTTVSSQEPIPGAARGETW